MIESYLERIYSDGFVKPRLHRNLVLEVNRSGQAQSVPTGPLLLMTLLAMEKCLQCPTETILQRKLLPA